jgi:hypothetical protein
MIPPLISDPQQFNFYETEMKLAYKLFDRNTRQTVPFSCFYRLN